MTTIQFILFKLGSICTILLGIILIHMITTNNVSNFKIRDLQITPKNPIYLNLIRLINIILIFIGIVIILSGIQTLLS